MNVPAFAETAKRRASKRSTIKKTQHRGYDIEVDEDRRKPKMRIAGKKLAVDPVKGKKKRFATPYLPYEESSSVEELANRVVDHSAEFETKD